MLKREPNAPPKLTSSKKEPFICEILEEEIFLGFRKMDGIDVCSVNEKFSINFDREYKKIIDKYISYGYLTKTSAGYKLTNNGILVSNFILADFLQ